MPPYQKRGPAAALVLDEAMTLFLLPLQPMPKTSARVDQHLYLSSQQDITPNSPSLQRRGSTRHTNKRHGSTRHRRGQFHPSERQSGSSGGVPLPTLVPASEKSDAPGVLGKIVVLAGVRVGGGDRRRHHSLGRGCRGRRRCRIQINNEPIFFSAHRGIDRRAQI